jgi:hypothetical protein
MYVNVDGAEHGHLTKYSWQWVKLQVLKPLTCDVQDKHSVVKFASLDEYRNVYDVKKKRKNQWLIRDS